MKRENIIAFSCGRKHAGKSAWLARRFVASAPRVIHVDTNGELLTDPNVLMCASYDDLLDALHAFAHANVREWRVAVPQLPNDDFVELFELLVPRENFGKASLSRAFGGVAIECGECHGIFPLHGTDEAILSAPRSGRHHRLDILMATQRAAACDVALRSMADVVAVFALDEPADFDWVRKKMGNGAADAVAQLPEHWHIEKHQGESFVRVLDANDREHSQISILGKGSVALTAPAGA